MQQPHHPDDLDGAVDSTLRTFLTQTLPADLCVRRALFRFWVESARLEREGKARSVSKPGQKVPTLLTYGSR